MSGQRPPTPPPHDPAVREFETLLVEHQHRIYFFIRSMVFNPEDARDVLQDVNAIIVRKHRQFTPATDFKSWAFAIARFECLTWLRRHEARTKPPADLIEHLAEGAEARADDTDAWLTALAECRKLLPPEGTQLLEMRYQGRVPLEEIARRWKTTEGALKQKLFRIRNQLKNCILQRRAGPNAEETRFGE